MSAALVEITRSGLIDAIHRGDVAVVDSDGALRASTGDPMTKVVYSRSAAKPFQAVAVVAGGAAQRWGFSTADLALVAGSHNGEKVHTDQASALLAKVGGDVSDLMCGVHPPLDEGAAEELLRQGVGPNVLHNNCSGKHIGMLALAKHLGGDRLDYASRDHPVQEAILRAISDFSGAGDGEVAVGIDGCGVPCFAMTVYRLALAFARLMVPGDRTRGCSAAAQDVRAAMAMHPYLVAGRGRFDTDLMQTGTGGLIAKGGAGGVACVGLPGGIGLAVKIEDGAMGPPPTPAPIVVMATLEQLGVLDRVQLRALSDHARPLLRNVAGSVVGGARAVFDLVMVTQIFNVMSGRYFAA